MDKISIASSNNPSVGYILFWHVQDRLLSHANCIWNIVAMLTKQSHYLSCSRFILCTKLQHSSDYSTVYKVSTTLTIIKGVFSIVCYA